MKRIPRRIFTAEFKLEAIKLVTEQGLSCTRFTGRTSYLIMQPIAAQLNGTAPRK